jgi:hypothetical protein
MADPVWGKQQNDMLAVLATLPTTIEEVVAKLKTVGEILAELSGGRPPLGGFNDLYHTITSDVLALREDGGFKDPGFLTELDLQFAWRYFQALQLWSHRDARTPSVWKILFAKKVGEATDLQGAMAGVNAHIDFDLAHALVETFKVRKLVPGPGKQSLQLQRHDYDKINDIFFEEIPKLRRKMYTNLLQKLLDKLVGTADDELHGLIVRETRTAAWRDAFSLWLVKDDPAAFALYSRALDDDATDASRIIFTPGFGNLVF